MPNPVMFDAGDMLGSTDLRRKNAVAAQLARKAEVMADFMKLHPPDAAAIGDMDLLLGPREPARLLSERGIAPIVTNADIPGTVRHAVFEAGGWRFLALNVLSRKALAGVEGVTYREPLEAIDAARAAAGNVDVVLIAEHGLDEPAMRRIAERGDFLKILVDGDDRVRLRSASLVTKTVVVSPPARGSELLVAELHLERGATAWYEAKRWDGSTLRDWEAETAGARQSHIFRVKHLKLDSTYPNDTAAARLQEDYKAWSRKNALASAPSSEGATPYRGAAACAECHADLHANWQTSYHAEAWTTLEKNEDGGIDDPECVSCHTSGFLLPGGPSRIEDTTPFRGVQCESCHVPAGPHPGTRFGKVKEETCVTCHSDTRDPNFDFKKYLPFATCKKSFPPGRNRVPRTGEER
jgi:predicted CXXCH cytochrome family protein